MLNETIWIEVNHKLKVTNYKSEALIVTACCCNYSAVFEKRSVNLFNLNQNSFLI